MYHVDTQVCPTLTKEQLLDLDMDMYDLATKACTGEFEHFKAELTSGKELLELVRASVISKAKAEPTTPSDSKLPAGADKSIEDVAAEVAVGYELPEKGSWVNPPHDLAVALDIAERLFQLVAKKGLDTYTYFMFASSALYVWYLGIAVC